MREIKFRAWDRTNKRMYQVSSIKLPYYNPPLMQFTGLLDNNGKEIYEGDILKDSVNESLIMTVKWVYHGFRLFYGEPPKQVKSIGALGWEMSTIIGNIYENPGLI